ncbi:zinc finger HIT domain-containing protein 3-like isoform X1 [Takifugu rubripes]|uniref:zinc finger HIT domain-containing protein 3-like isoform X1 n=1 Tax=Takifugu rubripes TaxID=31033 RepID=UPI001145B57B|nr:zinc finger HIT domain-containing protein 3-like isoform X1 [Takifugu rubripes]
MKLFTCLFQEAQRGVCSFRAAGPPEPPLGPNTKPWTAEGLLAEDDVTDQVPVQRLQLLGRSKELRDLLCNPHLRRLLRSIDSADRKCEAMKGAMHEPLFTEFSDQCLKIVQSGRITPSDD